MADNPVFQEVIGVEIDVDSFAQSLDKLISVYKDKLAELGSSTNGQSFIDTTIFSAINSDLEEVRSNLATLTEAFTHSFGVIGAQVTEVSNQIVSETARAAAEVDQQQAQSDSQIMRSREQTFKAYAKLLDQEEAAVGAAVNREEKQREAARAQELKILKETITERSKLEDQWAAEVGKQINREEKMREEARAQQMAALRADIIERSEAANAPSALERMLGNMKKDIPELIGNVVRFQAAWGVVGLIFTAVEKTLETIVNSFKEGWQYLTNLEEASADLQGVLADNVQFSANMSQNFNLAGQAAEQVVRRLQDVAIQTGLNVKQLQDAFKAFMEGGGANTVNNLEEAVTVTELLAVAMHASGKETQATRSLIGDIPKLLDGTIDKHSKLLEVLHLTKDEWKDIRDQALENHDLVQQLAPRLQPYLNVIEQAQLRQAVLTEQLDLMRQRAEALVAEPMWKKWTELLQQAKQWFVENEAAIDSILSSLGTLILRTVEFVGSLFKIIGGVNNIKDGFKGVAVILQALIEAVNVLLGLVTGVANIMSKMFATFFNPETFKNPKKALADFFEYAKEQAIKFSDDTNKSVARLSDTIFGTNDSTSTSADLLRQKFKALHDVPDNETKKFDNTELDHLRNKFSAELRLRKEQGDKERQEIKEQVDTGVRTKLDGFKAVEQSFKDEGNAIDQLIDKYKHLADVKTGAANPKSVERFVTQLNNDASSQRQSAFKGASDARIEQFKAVEKQALDSYRNEEKAARDAAKAETEIAQKNAKDGVITNQEAVNRERAAEEALHTRLSALYALEATAYNLTAEDKRKALEALAAEERRHAQQQAVLDAKDLDAKVRDLQLTMKADQEKRQADLGTVKRQLDIAKIKGDTTGRITVLNKQLADAQLALLKSELAETQAAIHQLQVWGVKGRLLDDLIAKQKALTAATAEAQAQDDRAAGEATVSGHAIEKTFGDGITNLQDAFDGFEKSVGSLHKAFDVFKNAANSIINGFKQGGIAGGIGAISSTIGGFIPGPAGEILSFAGDILSSISGIFTAAAKKIGAEIKKSISDAMTAFQEGAATLQQTIAKLEQERADAITRLSGKKGGKDQLNQILPDLDKQIASLKSQQKQIIDDFNAQLQQLQLHSSTLADFLKTWQDINKQVKAYLDAGGDAAKATAMLNEQLRQLKENAQNNLDQGETQAIQDALKLNDLIKQRVDLIKQEAQAEFNIMNQDAIEKRVAPAIAAATQLQQQRQQFQTQLQNLNSQIDLTSKRVAMEKQIFDIATDTATLQQQANAIELAQLGKQLDAYKDMLEIVNGIVTDSQGNNVLSDALRQLLGLGPNTSTNPSGAPGTVRRRDIQDILDRIGIRNLPNAFGINAASTMQMRDINVTVQVATGADPAQIGKAVSGEISSELLRRGRGGLGTLF